MRTVIEDFISKNEDFEIRFYFANGTIEYYYSKQGCLDLERKDNFIFFNQGVENKLINLQNVNYIELLPVIDN